MREGDKIKQILDIMSASNDLDTRNKQKKYLVKSYQRGYRWGTSQVYNLLNDIYVNYKKYFDITNKMGLSEDEQNGYEYCVQPLVLKKIDENDQEISYSVIDGQQRLTTFSLIFKALNYLEQTFTQNFTSTDAICIEYDRSDTKGILDTICDRCREIGDYVIPDNLDLEELAKYIEEGSDNSLNGIIEKASAGLNIDGLFIVNAYIYLHLFFRWILEQKQGSDNYFYFKLKDDIEGRNYVSKRLEVLRMLYKLRTTIIWYEPLEGENIVSGVDRTEEDIFEKFNSGKIPLTKSELVKALFMNPANYVKEGDEYNNEVIKTTQIMIGVKWDSIERDLHNKELWYFYPHYDQRHDQTRFDAVIDWLVFCEFKNRNPKVTKENLITMYEADKLFAYQQLKQWMKKDLDKACDTPSKMKIMKTWWDKVCVAYNDYAVFFGQEEGLIKIYHRLSLLHWLTKSHFFKITMGSKLEGYFAQLEKNKEIFDSIHNVQNNQKIQTLNKMILDEIQILFDNNKTTKVFSVEDVNGMIAVDKNKCTTLEQKIKALVYDSNNILIETFLIILNLQIMEKTIGTLSRFSFYSYNQQDEGTDDWIFEHIHARGTNLWTENPEQQRRLLQEIVDSDWKDYILYKFENVLTAREIAQIIDRKQHLVDLMRQMIQNHQINQAIFNVTDGYEADQVKLRSNLKNDEDGLLSEFLRDNSMGNMSLLTRKGNSSVNNESLDIKKERIMNKVDEGKFVPVATLNMFMGTYCVKDHSQEYWYPCHRKKYLEAMMKEIQTYLR